MVVWVDLHINSYTPDLVPQDGIHTLYCQRPQWSSFSAQSTRIHLGDSYLRGITTTLSIYDWELGTKWLRKISNHHSHGVFAGWSRLNNEAPIMVLLLSSCRMCGAHKGYTPLVIGETWWGGLERVGSFHCVGLTLANPLVRWVSLHWSTSWQDPEQSSPLLIWEVKQ